MILVPVLLAGFLVFNRQLGTLTFLGKPFAIRACEAAFPARENVSPNLDLSEENLDELKARSEEALRYARVAHAFVPIWKTLVEGARTLRDNANAPNPILASVEINAYVEVIKMGFTCGEVGKGPFAFE